MNKISKKIVALVTMAAFALTLVPAAAFADAEAPAPADVQTSEFHVVQNGSVADEVTIDSDETVTAQFYINDNTGVGTTAALSDGASSKIKVWAVDNATNQVTTALQSVTAVTDTSNATFKQCDGNAKVYKVETGNITNGAKIELKFSRAGEYTVYAGVGDFGDNGSVSPIEKLKGASVVTVEGATATVDKITIDGTAYTDDQATTTIKVDSMLANGIDTYTIKAYAVDENGKAVKNATFKLDTNKSGIDLEETTVTTDNVGMFEITFSMTKASDYKIYVNGDIAITINVAKAVDKKIDGIKNTTADAQTLLAGTDKKNFTEAAAISLEDAVQFTLTYDNGDEVNNVDLSAIEPAANVKNADHSKYLSIVSKPEKSKLAASDLKLVWSAAKEAYTLQYVGNTAADSDLLAGEYTVKVALTSGKTAEASFTLAEFGTIQDLVVKVQAKDYGADKDMYTNIDDKIVYGQDMKVIAKYVDENGIEINADNAEIGVTGDVTPYDAAQYKNQYRVTDNKDLIGSTITVKVFDSKAKKFVEKELTIVDKYDTYSLAFDSEKGEANKTNTVEVSVVNEDGAVVKSVNNAEVLAYIADQSNEDAKVEVTTDNNITSGKANIEIFSNEETTVDIVVAVKNGKDIYGGTLKYTVGAEDVNADTSAVMTIGSTDYVVNNEVVAGDAAPYVADSRTMVPIRALTETFGAEVNYDNDARTVTIKDGDTTVVMTIGEKTYTVNDEEQTMDVAPVIGSGDRTYVPVRFVAEALGYKVTPLYAADGTTASVVFQK